MHTGNRKIFVQLQNNIIQTLDVRIYRFLTSYNSQDSDKYGIYDTKLSDPALMSGFGYDATQTPTSIVDTPLIKACFSPCGYQLWSGEQSGKVLVYKTDTGDLTTVYDVDSEIAENGGGLGITSKIVDIAYHPHDHIVAFCAFGDNQPVVLFTWDEDTPQKEILVSRCIVSFVVYRRLFT
jgi:WD40 repeat protein